MPSPAEPPRWVHATPPDRSVVRVDGAILTPFRRAVLRPGAQVTGAFGAVYDAEGWLVPSSPRSGGHLGDLVHSINPVVVDPVAATAAAERLRGTWLYGGTWMAQFGHFISETLPTLWPTRDDIAAATAATGGSGGSEVAGIVFHRFLDDGTKHPWQLDLLRRAGWQAPVRIVRRDDPVVVDSLLVPSRPVVINMSAQPAAVDVWDRVAATVAAGSSRRVYFSRSRLADDARRLVGDDQLDAAFAALGFDVVFPEELDVADQIAAVRGADVVLAVAGSALHLTAFAPSHTRVIEIGDARSPAGHLSQQRVIDAARRRTSAFVPLLWHADESRDVEATRDAVASLLDQLPGA